MRMGTAINPLGPDCRHNEGDQIAREFVDNTPEASKTESADGDDGDRRRFDRRHCTVLERLAEQFPGGRRFSLAAISEKR